MHQDWDDFVVWVPEGNGSKDDAYVEIYDEDGAMVDNGTTDDDSLSVIQPIGMAAGT